MFLGEMVRARELIGKIDYIISSHNFEHIPDPTRFLQDCEKVLKPGGVLSMAIPDHRRCFDILRPQSTIGAIVEAYVMRHQQPTISQVFDSLGLKAHRKTDAGERDWEIGIDPAEIYLEGDLEGLYEFAQRSHKDAHCWTFTPASFAAIIRDLQLSRLVRMTLTEVSPSNGNEFYVTMTNRPAHLQDLGRPVDLLREAAGLKEHHDSLLVRQQLNRLNADAAAAELQQAQAAKDSTEAELQQMQAAKDATEAELQRVRAALDATYRSHSWRVTMPLRAIITAMRGMGGRRIE